MNLSEINVIRQQANQWLVKLETGEMLDGDEERFVEWLEADNAHSQAFHEAEQVWKAMHQVGADEITSLPDAQNCAVTEAKPQAVEKTKATRESKVIHLKTSQEPSTIETENTASTSKITWFSRVVMPLAATFLLAFWSLFWGQSTWLSITSDHYAATGHTKVHLLPDGSELTLNTNTAVNIRFTENRRLVELVSGEIYVDVFSDKTRPFVVQAGDMQVTALGTEFMVRKDGTTEPTVAVTEHSVKVENLEDDNTSTVLQEGLQVTLLQKRNLLTNPQTIDIKKVQSWKKGKLVFSNEPLSTVVAELNRYTNSKIVLRNSHIEDLRVTGVLDLDDPLAALQKLAHQLDLSFNQVTPLLIFIEQG